MLKNVPLGLHYFDDTKDQMYQQVKHLLKVMILTMAFVKPEVHTLKFYSLHAFMMY